MNVSRSCWLAVTSLTLLLTIHQVGRAQPGFLPAPYIGPLSGPYDITGEMYRSHYIQIKPAEKNVSTCKVYSLSDLGDDPNLGKWIADTIPQMIHPGSWSAADGKSKLSYYAPGKILVINQPADVHAQVDEFLRSLKKSLPQRTTKLSDFIVPAQFAVPDRAVSPISPAQAYPVPATVAAPKHLFHFIIRYEGDGIIDANVVKFAKALNAQENANGNMPQTTIPIGPPPGAIVPSGSYLQFPPQYYPPAAPPCPPMMPPADAPAPRELKTNSAPMRPVTPPVVAQ